MAHIENRRWSRDPIKWRNQWQRCVHTIIDTGIWVSMIQRSKEYLWFIVYRDCTCIINGGYILMIGVRLKFCIFVLFYIFVSTVNWHDNLLFLRKGSLAPFVSSCVHCIWWLSLSVWLLWFMHPETVSAEVCLYGRVMTVWFTISALERRVTQGS